MVTSFAAARDKPHYMRGDKPLNMEQQVLLLNKHSFVHLANKMLKVSVQNTIVKPVP
jgi:hypothetical protein